MSDKETDSSENATTSEKPLFRELNADDLEPETTEIESFCVNCHENGVTRLLLTKIPHYKDVVVMSFSCSHCHYSNNELQSAGPVQDKGVRYCLEIKSTADLDRQLVKSDYTSIRIPHLDFEIPSQSQRGEVTTVEGVLKRSEDGIRQDQEKRKEQHPELAENLERFAKKLEQLREVAQPFEMIVEDISGNSWVENPSFPKEDPNCKVTHFVRTREDDHTLGVYAVEEISDQPKEEEERSSGVLRSEADTFTYEDLQGEVLHFQTNCPSCAAPCTTNMKMTHIPYFKEVVIMATTCDSCGHRTNEVKSGGGIEETGIRIKVNVTTPEDLARDILKSETCHVSVPEIGLEVGPTTLGGRFTTVEGLLTAMRDQLFTQSTIFSDSRPERHIVFTRFLDKLNGLISGEEKFTLLLDDPAGNSYVQSFTSPEPDSQLTVERYERSFDENEELGLNDIKTENYEET